MTQLTGDQLVYLGKISEWLKAAPITNMTYGQFHIGTVEVCFDGEKIGVFVDELGNNDGWTLDVDFVDMYASED